MAFQHLVSEARDLISVRRVFGEPYEKDGVTVIPVARVFGGGGGGGGEGPADEGGGEGGGFGLFAGPVGAYTIRSGEVTWVPAVDVNLAIAVGGLLGLAAQVTLRSIVRARARARRKRG